MYAGLLFPLILRSNKLSNDIATLGLAIDSRQVVSAKKALDDLTGAAKPAAAAAAALEKSTSKARDELGRFVKQSTDAAAATAKARDELGRFVKQSTDAAAATAKTHKQSTDAAAAASALEKSTAAAGKAHAGMSTQAMAAQHSMRSLIEAMASGQPISQALGQQLNHLSYAATGPGGISGAFKQAAGAMLGMLNPATLVVGGLAAVAAGSALAINSIAKTEKAFDDTSRAAGTTISKLHDLAAAASFKGIAPDDFLKGADKFAASVYEAQHNAGGLAEVMRANGKSAKDFTGYLETAADLIKNASSDQARLQLLQQMGLPATMDWVRFLWQGKDGIRAATAEATKFGSVADEALVAKARKFDEEWAKATTNLTTYLKGAFVGGLGYVNSFGEAISAVLMKAGVNVGKNSLTDAFRGGPTASTRLSQSSANDFYNAVGNSAPWNAAEGAGKTKNPADLQRQIALAQPPLGLFGQTPTAKQASEPKPTQDNKNDRDRLPRAA